MTEIPKRRFVFKPVEGFVDLYLNGQKVINKHRGSTGNCYFRIPQDVKVEFSVAEHDANIPLEMEVTAEGFKTIERRPKFIENPPIEINIKELAEATRAKAAVAKKEKTVASME